MNGRVIVLQGDAARLPLPDASVDACVTDPPYGLAELPAPLVIKALTAWLAGDREYVPGGAGFMGKSWDRFVPPPAAWDECLRVLKPGGHLLAFASPRTADLMGLSIRLAGFEIRDGFSWVFGSGMPKSLDVGKAIDRAAGAAREIVGTKTAGQSSLQRVARVEQGYRDNLTSCTPEAIPVTAPATEDAARWDGWGTATKPAHEPVIMARKPLSEGTVAGNVLRWGTGALNVDATRVNPGTPVVGGGNGSGNVGGIMGPKTGTRPLVEPHTAGRWPPNVLLSEDAAAELDRQSGALKSAVSNGKKSGTGYHGNFGAQQQVPGFGDEGGASRYFPVFKYAAKASSEERPRLPDGTAWPTVKPLELIRWMARLVTRPGGTILDPFCGTGTLGEAAIVEGFDAILLDKDPVAIELTRVRLAKPIQPDMFGADPGEQVAPVPVPKPAPAAQESLFNLDGSAA